MLALLTAACGGGDGGAKDPSPRDGDGGSTTLDGGAQGEDGDVGDGKDAGGDVDTDATVPDEDGGMPEEDGGTPGLEYLALFDQATLPVFKITLTPEAMAALELDSETYQSGSVQFGDEPAMENVGIRLKGRASAQGFDGKPAFKLKFNEFVPKRRFKGLKRITLNNMVQDPTMARERIGYTLFRAMGVPAPLCNGALVYVNDEFYGVYANVQTLDDVFVEDTFGGDEVGNLYDITNEEYFIDFERGENETIPQEDKFVLETNEELNDKSDLTALIEAASTSSDEEFLPALEAVMDLDEVLTMGAVQAVIADWDGYFGARNNYKAYHVPDGRFVLFPWGIDQTFWIGEGYIDYALDHSNSERPRSIILTRCLENPSCLSRYNAKISEAVDVLDTLDLGAQVDDIEAQIRDARALDTRSGYASEDHLRELGFLRDFLRMRPAIVRGALP